MPQKEDKNKEMSRAYQPDSVESRWYRYWLDKGYFKAGIDPGKKPFVIIMPPPNVTGELHIGHALTATMEDIMTRWHRMKGDPSLWLPGFDHAGIAAQVVVEQALAREGLDRHKLGREDFLKRMYRWAEQCQKKISEQHQRLGVSCDWSRERFTLDEGPSRAVRTTFVKLYEKGLIYRGERIINWCPRCSTAISDLEVDHKNINGHLYYVNYPLAENKHKFVTVATTRPETILGDTAVAVNPEDKRYKGLIGKKVTLPILGRDIPIIADEAIDTGFGTGAVKITPAHDPVDFEVSQRQDLPLINIINLDATMNENAGPYAGMDRFSCRDTILSDLRKEGLLVKVDPYSHAVGHCQRCSTIIEPLASKQWFVRMGPLAQPAIEAVTGGDIKIIPEHFTRVYLNWLENIRDWCISRQLWWGHRIPVWYCHECGELTVSVDEVKKCRSCASNAVEQDPDVLDTWFSSALWTHSTVGWPDDTEDLRYFYPTTVMETGYDILFFWVARMIMMGIENTGLSPFHTVYLHGLIRDENGEKMSKVRGNVINPLDTVEQYGTDALRFALSTGTSPGNDIKLTPARLEAGRNFANKLWNATRFIIRCIGHQRIDAEIGKEHLSLDDRWILSRLNQTVNSVSGLMEDFQFGEAERQTHDFLWGDFCDWYIEIAKIRMQSDGSLSPLPVLVHVMETSLRLLHPFMPFITEELWQNLTGRLLPSQAKGESIMISPYPQAVSKEVDQEAERVLLSVIEIIRSIRNARSENHVENNRWVTAKVYAGELLDSISPYRETIESLARAKPLTFVDSRADISSEENALVIVLAETEVAIPMKSMIDIAAERNRLQKEIAEITSVIRQQEARLSNTNFLTKAPAAVIDKEKEKLAARKSKMDRLKEQLSAYS